ncbi:hypothetical protein JCM14036_01160 [Desulfotomaculum defluvii]
MATIFQLKRGSTAQVNTYSGNAAEGELVLDTTLNQLYVGQSDGSLRLVNPNITVAADAPTIAEVGDLWFDTDDNKLYVCTTASSESPHVDPVFSIHTYTAADISDFASGVDAQLAATTTTATVLTHATIDGGVLVPELDGISPNDGPLAGNTSVTLTGTGFFSATGVNFGATPAASYTIDSDIQITAISPAGTEAGAVDVTVTGPGGASDAVTFTYLA